MIIGDKVICHANFPNNGPKKGCIYTIREILKIHGRIHFISLEEIFIYYPDFIKYPFYYIYNFSLVKI